LNRSWEEIYSTRRYPQDVGFDANTIARYGVLLDQLGGIHPKGLGQVAACLRPGLCAVALNAGERGYGDPCFLRQRPSTEGQDHSHACNDGVVYIGHLVEDPGTGEEVEVIEAVPCRRCAEEAR
jgi:hypothetical protein